MEMLYPFVKEAFQGIGYIVKFSCCVHVTHNYLCYFASLTGPSMLPTFSHGDLVLVERISSHLGKIGQGDLVQLQAPDYPRKIVTKRVKGVEGDTLSYSTGSNETKTVTVPKGHVWVEGDNAEVSNDSRKFGPVPFGLLQGRIFRKVWPSRDSGFVSNKLP